MITVEEIILEIERMISFYSNDNESESNWTLKRLKYLLDWIKSDDKKEGGE